VCVCRCVCVCVCVCVWWESYSHTKHGMTARRRGGMVRSLGAEYEANRQAGGRWCLSTANPYEANPSNVFAIFRAKHMTDRNERKLQAQHWRWH
jgi:hypothetical protein